MKSINQYLWLLIIMVVMLPDCNQPYKGTYLDYKNAHQFLACPSEDISDPKDHAFDALLATLSDNNWVIEHSSREKKKLTARACRYYPNAPGDYLKRKDNQCATIKFFVIENGDIMAANPKEKRFNSRIQPKAKDWMKALDRTYSELRCFSKKELRRRSPGKKDE